MTLLVDMNLSPRWVPYLAAYGLRAVHWTEVGDPRASDAEILRWARENGSLVFTHDLDFAHLLSMTRRGGPSVIQARTQDVAPESLGPALVSVLREHSEAITKGALVTLEPGRLRIRILPILRS